MSTEDTDTASRPTSALEQALAHLAEGRFEDAGACLRGILAKNPGDGAAAALLDVSRWAGHPEELRGSSRLIKDGMASFVAGQKPEALESWKRALASQPENRRRQLLVLFSATSSLEQRKRYAEEVVSQDHGTLGHGSWEEVQALLFLAQTTEEAASLGAEPTAEAAPEPAKVEDSSDEQAALSDLDTATTNPAMRAYADKAESPAARAPRRRSAKTKSNRTLYFAVAAVVAVALASATIILFSGNRGEVPEVRLAQADSLVGAGQFEEAVSAYTALTEEFGEHADIYLGRGRARLAAGNVDGGIADLDHAMTLAPERVSVGEEIADAYYSRTNHVLAIEHYERSFAAGHESARGRYRLAVSLVQASETTRALEHVSKSVAADPAHGEAQFLYGQLLNRAARFGEAEDALRAAASRIEAGGDYLAQLATAQLGQRALDAAEETTREFVRLYPLDARAPALLGEIYLRRQQYEQARVQLIQALRTDRFEPRAQIALAQTWLAIGIAGEDPQALAKAREVLEGARDVDEGARLSTLGQLALAEGDLASAERLLDASLGQGAEPLPVYLAIAESKARGDDLDGAATALRQAQELAESDPAITLSLAVAYSELDDAAAATDAFIHLSRQIGLTERGAEGAGPVVLPAPYIPLPPGFDIVRAMKEAARAVLQDELAHPLATELSAIAESTTFAVGSR